MSPAAPTADEHQQDPSALAARDAWVAAVSALADQVEGWCRARDWPAKRGGNRVRWDPLGSYEAERVLFHTGDRQYRLAARSRLTADSADGHAELAILPEYDTFTLLRKDGRWLVCYPDSPPGGAPLTWVPWDETLFVQLLAELERVADEDGGW